MTRNTLWIIATVAVLAGGGGLFIFKQPEDPSIHPHGSPPPKEGKSGSREPREAPSPKPDDEVALKLDEVVARLHEAPLERRSIVLSELGRTMRSAIAKSSEALDECLEVLSELDQNDRNHLLRLFVLDAVSPSGGVVDFQKKRQWLKELGYDESHIVYKTLLSAAGKDDPVEVVSQMKVLKLSDAEVIRIVSAAAVEKGIRIGSDCIDSIPGEELQGKVFKSIGPTMLKKDPGAVANWIKSIQSPALKKQCVEISASWLRSKNDEVSAKQLEGLLE